MTHIDAARKTGETPDGATVALLRHTHVTSALAAACEQFPLSNGEWAVVVLDGEIVTDCDVHGSLLSAEAGFESATQ